MASENDTHARGSRVMAAVVTNAIKLGGLYVGVRAAEQGKPPAVVLGLAAFMMAGAQLSEGATLALIERFFGVKQ